jgi:hypothetical protein
VTSLNIQDISTQLAAVQLQIAALSAKQQLPGSAADLTNKINILH